MLSRIKGIFKNSFNRNVMMIAGGTIFSQVLTVTLSPIITRIYSPQDYGVLTVFTAILGIISLLGALSYESAIPIAENDEKALNILVLCIVLLILFTSLTLIILTFFGESILNLLNADALLQYKYFLSLGFFVTGLYTILTNWLFRKKDFKTITKTKINQSFIGNLTKIIMGLLSFGPIGLLLGTILGQSAGITSLAKPILKLDKKIFKSINKNEILDSLKRYINFPLFSAPTIFLTSISSQFPVIFISSMYGASNAGFYGLALTVTFLPMTFLGKSIQDVFYGEAASIGKKNPEKVKELSTKLLKNLILIGLIPMLVLVFWGPDIFSIVFGNDWYDAGVYSRLLSFFAFSHLIFHPISVVFSIYEQQKKFFILNIVKLLLVLITFGISKLFMFDSYAVVFIFSISMAFTEWLKYILAQRVMNEEIKNNQIY